MAGFGFGFSYRRERRASPRAARIVVAAITGASDNGALDGQTLSAPFVATGTYASATRQWRVGGAAVAGATAAQLLADATALGLTHREPISCLIRLLDAEGAEIARAEPSVLFFVPLVANVSAVTATVLEGGTLVYRVSLPRPVDDFDAPVWVTYLHQQNDTHSNPGDAADLALGFVSDVSLPFAVGQQDLDVSFGTIDDIFVEPAYEGFRFTITDASPGILLGTISATAEVMSEDFDPAPGEFSIADASVLEGDSGTTPAFIPWSRANGSYGAGSFDLTLELPGGAGGLSGADVSGPLTVTIDFIDGQTSGSALVTNIVGDTAVEGNEVGTVTMSNLVLPSGTIDNGTATLTVIGDDSGASVATSVSQYGITYSFSEARPVSQYPVTGDFQVEGTVTIVGISPASTAVSGTYSNGTAYTSQEVNGAQLNPGNRADAGGSKANNSGNRQGYNGIPSISGTYSGVAYTSSLNVHPSKTGAPLVVTNGTVVMQTTNLSPNTSIRPGGLDMTVLTVVDALGSPTVLRPGQASSTKTHAFDYADLDISILQSVARPAGTPAFDSFLAAIKKPLPFQITDSVNGETAQPKNNGGDYVRDMAAPRCLAMLAMHLDWTDDETRQLAACVHNDMIDIADRIIEGGTVGAVGSVSGGNGACWKGPSLYLGTAMVENATTLPEATARSVELTEVCADPYVVPENWQHQKLTREHVDVTQAWTSITGSTGAGSGNDGAPNVPLWMVDAVEFLGNGSALYGVGIDYPAEYRAVCDKSSLPGIIATYLAAPAWDLWNRPEMKHYADMARHRQEIEGDWGTKTGSNDINAYEALLLETLWPVDNAPPTLEAGKYLPGATDATVWLRFSRALDMSQAFNPAHFVIEVDGVPVTGVTMAPAVSDIPHGVFGTNVGLKVASVLPRSGVTVSYTGGSALRSVPELVNVAPFTDQPLIDVTPRTAHAEVVSATSGGLNAYRTPIGPTADPIANADWFLAMMEIKTAATHLPNGAAFLRDDNGTTGTFNAYATNGTGMMRVAGAAGTYRHDTFFQAGDLNQDGILLFYFNRVNSAARAAFCKAGSIREPTSGWTGTPSANTGVKSLLPMFEGGIYWGGFNNLNFGGRMSKLLLHIGTGAGPFDNLSAQSSATAFAGIVPGLDWDERGEAMSNRLGLGSVPPQYLWMVKNGQENGELENLGTGKYLSMRPQRSEAANRFVLT